MLVCGVESKRGARIYRMMMIQGAGKLGPEWREMVWGSDWVWGLGSAEKDSVDRQMDSKWIQCLTQRSRVLLVLNR